MSGQSGPMPYVRLSGSWHLWKARQIGRQMARRGDRREVTRR